MAIPILALLIIDPTKNRKYIYMDYILRPGLAFVFWSVLGVLLIYFSYQYSKPNAIVSFSLLKIGKFAMYAAIPVIISRKLQFESIRNDFDWMILGACLILGASTILSPGHPSLKTEATIDFYYKALNLVSNVLAIFIIFLTGLLVVGYGAPRWRQAVKFSLIIILVGFSFTKGRGGWLAAVSGFVYLAYARGLLRARVLVGIFACLIALGGLFIFNEEFRLEVSRLIISPSESANSSQIQVSDGERVMTWMNEIVKFPNAPIFGTGFHHRGGMTGLWWTGSHNFWLQIFLETGLIGGGLVILIFSRMWRHANGEESKKIGISIPLKAALVTAFVGGLGGEYFYGGMGLLAILLCYAPVGAHSVLRHHSTTQI